MVAKYSIHLPTQGAGEEPSEMTGVAHVNKCVLERAMALLLCARKRLHGFD